MHEILHIAILSFAQPEQLRNCRPKSVQYRFDWVLAAMNAATQGWRASR
jgi:hypothetical protein